MALKNYTRIFHKDGVFKNSACDIWREQANKISIVTRDILRVLKVCVFLFKIFAAHTLPSDVMYTCHVFIEQEVKHFFPHILICYPPGKFCM